MLLMTREFDVITEMPLYPDYEGEGEYLFTQSVYGKMSKKKELFFACPLMCVYSV